MPDHVHPVQQWVQSSTATVGKRRPLGDVWKLTTRLDGVAVLSAGTLCPAVSTHVNSPVMKESVEHALSMSTRSAIAGRWISQFHVRIEKRRRKAGIGLGLSIVDKYANDSMTVALIHVSRRAILKPRTHLTAPDHQILSHIAPAERHLWATWKLSSGSLVLIRFQAVRRLVESVWLVVTRALKCVILGIVCRACSRSRSHVDVVATHSIRSVIRAQKSHYNV